MLRNPLQERPAVLRVRVEVHDVVQLLELDARHASRGGGIHSEVLERRVRTDSWSVKILTANISLLTFSLLPDSGFFSLLCGSNPKG
jgi:hypothetical protein